MIPAQRNSGTMRAAIYCRISRDDDSSTSIATQEKDARAWCQLRGYEVVMVRHDIGVSGSVRPEDREGFAEIIASLEGIDTVVARSVDRFSRVTSHFATLVELLDKRGTTLADVQGQADLTSPYGRFVVTLMVAFAQLERETIQQRILRSRVELRQNGNWMGGAAPYGFRIVADGDKGKRLDIDETAAAVLREIVDRVNSGHTLSAEVDRLNSSGELSPGDYRKVQRGEEAEGAKWTYSALHEHLRSEVLRGYRVQGKRAERRVVRDSEGKPVRVGPALTDDQTWRTLQATLTANGQETRRPRRKATLLLHVAWCPLCDESLYYNSREYKGKRLDLYTCGAARYKKQREAGDCPGVSINAARLETEVEKWVLTRFGPIPYMERVLIGGNDTAELIEELESDIAELASSIVGLRGAAKAAVMAQLDARQEALEEAQAEPVQAPEWKWVPTGETIAARWNSSDTAGKRLLLLSMHIRANVSPATKGRKWDAERVSIDLHFDDPEAAALASIALDESGFLD